MTPDQENGLRVMVEMSRLAAPPASPAAVELFVYFSRFEFALKETGFVKAGRNNVAEPDWERFSALPVVSATIEALRSDETARYLMENPPRRQIVIDKRNWAWQDVAGPLADTLSFLNAIKRVRNNLFHGGKSGDDPRDESLCVAATAALARLLQDNEELRCAFLGKY